MPLVNPPGPAPLNKFVMWLSIGLFVAVAAGGVVVYFLRH